MNLNTTIGTDGFSRRRDSGCGFSRRKIKAQCMLLLMGFIVSTFMISGCSKEETTDQYPFILFKQGDQFIQEGDRIPVGGQLSFGISAVGGGSAISYFRVKRITAESTTVEMDKGLWIPSGGIDTTLYFVKGPAEEETWNFFIMNENRDTASAWLTIFKGDGSAYGDIYHYPSITLGYPSNAEFMHFLDLDAGLAYDEANVNGHEQEVDLAAFWYITSGKSSPTLTCPGYTSAITYYPLFETWPVRNTTLYDYKTSDNDLVSAEQFDAAENDSLLVAGYLPQNVSGLCKYAYTGKIIPFKTAAGKYGMVKVIRADEQEGGSMEIAIKIQQ